MLQPDRAYNSDLFNVDYRYGFQGQEKDDEIKGTGNSYDYGARFFDPRVGRWLNGDPMESKFPSLTTYGFVLNNPINYYDPDGKVARNTNDNSIIFFSIEKPKLESSTFEIRTQTGTQIVTYTAIVQRGYVFTNSGKAIPVLKKISGDDEWNTNCHGCTFLDEEYWLNPKDLSLLLDEEWVGSEGLVGEILIYENKINKGSDHSLTIVGINPENA